VAANEEYCKILIRRIAREQGWRPCCRTFVIGRVLGDLTRPIGRHPITGAPLCPRCRRKAVADVVPVKSQALDGGERIAA
jgi:hypothetical protein